MGQMTKTCQKLDSKIREIDWLHLCPQQFDDKQAMTGNGNNTNLLKFAENNS